MKLLIFYIVIRTITHVHCAETDPLGVIKDYYYEHEAAQDTDIPIVNEFEKSYDFIVIGGGSAGCVVANRLSEVPEWNVLLLEAGEQEDFLTDVPILLNMIPGSKRDWKYKTVKRTNNCLATQGSCKLPRGKVLGGSSVLNAIVYTRGDKQDFDEWGQLGNHGWSYKDVLGYFKKSEDLHIETLMNPEYRGTGGYLSVNYTGFETPLLKSFLEAAQLLGHNIVDYNDGNEAGFARIQVNSLHGRRDSAAKAFLRPAASRKNLSIATSAFVTKILIHPWKKVAYGVEFVKNGVTHKVMAKQEVALCAGAIGSPQILMLSGVGPWTDLLLTGILPLQNLKVGYNLRDHIAIRDLKFFYDGDFTTINVDNLRSPNDVADYFQKGTGPLTVPVGFEGIGFLHTTEFEKSGIPDAELLLASLMLDFTKLSKDSPMKREAISDKSFLMMGILVKPKSVGRLWLKSKDPEAHPAIDPNFLGDKSDVKRMVEIAKMVRNC